jgi:hypothetical protein
MELLPERENEQSSCGLFGAGAAIPGAPKQSANHREPNDHPSSSENPTAVRIRYAPVTAFELRCAEAARSKLWASSGAVG